MYIVTKDGHKLPVDDSSIDYEHDYVPFVQQATVITDDTILKPVWIAQCFKDILWGQSRVSDKNERYEFVAEKKFTHKPTNDELIYFMSAWGLSRNDIVMVEEGLELDEEYDD